MGERDQKQQTSEGIRATTMQAAILALGVVTLPMLLISFGMGYCAHFGWLVQVATHVKIGLLTVLLTILTHTTTMFYFMGTGSAIKSEVKERKLNSDFLVRAREFKGKFFYLLTFSILLIMVTAMIGGGSHADLLMSGNELGRSIFSIAHEVLSIITLIVNMVALIWTPLNISKNNQLLDDLGETRVRDLNSI